ncbi:oligosaccharide flippase family protein [Parabacteroides goldsteinii]|uniref:oligosaccharide flippase family protein n=1 Tax=Parabacteroides goldsteinii TaxID=328812 RepID=UPI0026773A10|nr:oligosaccharide flippase family protein [Parabacteroides goldsteinii]
MKLFSVFSKYNIIVKNTSYLSILELLKMVMPFIALPYIIRIVGSESYGLIAFIQTMISYFGIFINWGLDISAVKDVAIAKNDKYVLGEIVSSVLLIKFLLWLISLIVLLLLFIFIPMMRENKLLILFAFLSCLSEVFFPVWYFQGRERMKDITLIRSVSILFYVSTLFFVVTKKSDYIYIPLLQSIGLLLSSFISICVVIKRDGIRFSLYNYYIIKRYFIDSIPFFVSRLSVLLNSGMAKIVCGFFFSMQSVAALDIAQKIASASFIPLQMLNQALYPYFARTKDTVLARKGLVFMFLLSLAVMIFVFAIAPFAIGIFAGNQLPESIVLLRIMGLYIVAGGISLYLGTPILVAFGYPKPFNMSVIFSSFILFGFYFILYLSDFMSINNFALVLGISELFIALYRYYYCSINKLFSYAV